MSDINSSSLVKFFLKSLFVTMFLTGTFWLVGKKLQSRLPRQDQLVQKSYREPIQTPLSPDQPKNFFIFKGDRRYEVQAVANYEMAGLVVEESRSNAFLAFQHEKWGDFLNTKDICVIWDPNFSEDRHRQVSFSHGEFTCYVRWYSQETALDMHAISNNHLLTEASWIEKMQNEIAIGDEVWLKGQLVNYSIDGTNFRNTSTTRTDTEGGACEVVLVQDLKIIKSHGALAHKIMRAGRFFGAVSLICLFGLMSVIAFDVIRAKIARP